MKRQREWVLIAALFLAAATALAQQPPAASAPQAKGKITPDEARQLFSLVDELIQFSSNETGLPIKSTVKRRITSRSAVESYLKQKMEEDESARRLERSEIVLKKFGLLERGFNLKPFLLDLLGEQIEAYYDSKTKTISMLDWVGIEEQKPVLAHELTHALQDQHSDLEKWIGLTPEEVSFDSAADTDHLAKDEIDSARTAVVEGQATVVMMDYMLKPMGKSLVKNPEVMDVVRQLMSHAQASPMLERAPLLLSESLLFPYREGLNFEQQIWMDEGQAAAFTGTLDQPPSSSWEIMNPREYEARHSPAVPRLPNIHPLLDPLYKPYDIGQLGQLDVKILTETLGGQQTASQLTPKWNGGLYWAGQRLSANTSAEKSSTNSIALFSLTAWKNAESAQAYARLYAQALGRKYDRVTLVSGEEGAAKRAQSFKVFPPPVDSSDADASSATPASADRELIYSTSEGTVVIATRGRRVFIAESFPLELARKLAALVLDAQGVDEMKKTAAAEPIPESLTSGWIRFFSNCGVMKAAVDAEIKDAAH
jgi:hypothetical protein